ncbi:HIT domain-containing protein [Halapricum sp. CBA1109]|uniref:HIT family protein n=1 Tax=Halapricum sp. CBA1109 TaxID=2668068 RepID=UPI0012FC3993|nr:HIT family protein [Halapricum sp. CBA1109]MUV90773.1 HIT domain-containing protein [Halapricum sp. CBA1109]
MSEDCIFCSIVDGEIPSRTVYEDDTVLAFLDANPLAPGHTLVIPKTHYERLNDVPAATASELYARLHELVPAVEDAADAPASTVAFNNGEAAGQEVPHVHAHVVPRTADDGGGPIHGVFGSRPDLSDDELDALADAIRDNQ